ncbi:hypothetical protein AWM68_02490 [Fictibacillus phosphorivorans]|uniref:Uncharacterized protein n=1 Tax=Fictibacillus phosphorivorans TaxID=1221500 RepID=A0A161TIW7_9BACL|nr:hypothetical protein AWM68_02490 [Fictibacillus phosphorivorans]
MIGRTKVLNKRQRYVFLVSSVFIIGIVIFNIFYEPFPVKNVNVEAVLKMVNQSEGKMVKIPSKHQGYQWYISINEKADDNLKMLMKDKGWSYKKKSSSDTYYFESVQGNISVHRDRWNENYTIFYFPEGI